jgi:hypothetical protein
MVEISEKAMTPREKKCLALVYGNPLQLAKYDAKSHFELTLFGEEYLKEIFIFVHKGYIELLPPTEEGQYIHCTVKGIEQLRKKQ